MGNQKNKALYLNKFFLKLAFEQAKKNLGHTKNNPSVGCVLVKNHSIISSDCTSIGGRPHAEMNALKFNKDYKDSTMYVTLEPCTHHGLTSPCSDIIIRKGIKKVFFSFNDKDIRTAKKLKKILSKRKIKSQKIPSKEYQFFYQSYFDIHKNKIPYMDAKIAVSKDYLTISKKTKWITNQCSRKRTHLLRSQYDSIITTSKTINIDNAMMNCRINGMNQNKPDLIIIDLKLKLKKNLKLFKINKSRKIWIITSFKNKEKMYYFKKQGLKFIFIKSLKNKNDFTILMNIIRKRNYNRILCESGLSFLNTLLKYKLIYNLYLFKSTKNLGKLGFNRSTKKYLKKLKLINKIKVNLNGESLYKIKIKNV